MKNWFSGHLRNHPLMLLYVLGILLVFHSVGLISGSVYMMWLAVYVAGLIFTYFGLACLGRYIWPSCGKRREFLANKRHYDLAPTLLIWLSGSFIILHFVSIGGIPILNAMLSNDYYDIMRVRQSIFFDASAFFRYGANLVIKSILPFLAIYCFVTGNSKKSAAAITLGTLYGAALMNKMLILIPIAPLLIYFVLKRKPLAAALLAAIPVALLGLLVLVQNPHIRPEFWTTRELATASGVPMYVEAPSPFGVRSSRAKQVVNVAEIEETKAQSCAFRLQDSSVLNAAENLFMKIGLFMVKSFQYVVDSTYPVQQFIETIYLRVIVVPGKVIVAWFTNIPSNLPYGYGCGYRWLAPFHGCDYINYSRQVNDLMLPKLAAEGIKGTMTAASFMEDYANFGMLGIVLGSMVMAIILWCFTRVYKGQWVMALSLNAVPILMLLEMSLSTVMITGGWLLTGLLFLFFSPRLQTRLDQAESQK